MPLLGAPPSTRESKGRGQARDVLASGPGCGLASVPACCLPDRPQLQAGGALKQDARPPHRVSAVVFGHRWALPLRPCPRPGGAPGTGPGARRSVGEDLLPRATATIQAARGNVRHKVFTSSAAHPGNGFWVWVWCGLALVFMWVWSGLVPGFMWAWSGLVLGFVWARCGFGVGFVSMRSAHGLGSFWADRSVWAWCGFGAHMLSAVPVACIWCRFMMSEL